MLLPMHIVYSIAELVATIQSTMLHQVQILSTTSNCMKSNLIQSTSHFDYLTRIEMDRNKWRGIDIYISFIQSDIFSI